MRRKGPQEVKQVVESEKQAYATLKSGKNKPVFIYYNVRIQEDCTKNVLNLRSPLFRRRKSIVVAIVVKGISDVAV